MTILRDRPVTSSTFSIDRDAFDEVAVLHDAADLGEDRRRERIPLRDDLARRDALAVLDLEHRAVHQAVMLALATGVVHDHELAVAIHDDDRAVALALTS